MITLTQGLLLALMAFLVGFDDLMEAFFVMRPIMVATFTGIILGDIETGVIAGGLVELAFAGLTPAGGASVPNGTIAGIMTVFLAVTQDISPEEAFPLALPFSFLMQYLGTIKSAAFAFFMKPADEMAAKGNVRGLVLMHIGTLAITGLCFAVVTFLCTYAAQDLISDIVAAFPQPLMNGLSVAGGVLPAVGFCMLLSILLKKEFIAYLIIGFVSACFISFGNILPVALIGLALALLDYFNHEKEAKQANGGVKRGI